MSVAGNGNNGTLPSSTIWAIATADRTCQSPWATAYRRCRPTRFAQAPTTKTSSGTPSQAKVRAGPKQTTPTAVVNTEQPMSASKSRFSQAGSCLQRRVSIRLSKQERRLCEEAANNGHQAGRGIETPLSAQSRAAAGFREAIEPSAARRLELALGAVPVGAHSSEGGNECAMESGRGTHANAAQRAARPHDGVRAIDPGGDGKVRDIRGDEEEPSARREGVGDAEDGRRAAGVQWKKTASRRDCG
jgi:hypothetical protein